MSPAPTGTGPTGVGELAADLRVLLGRLARAARRSAGPAGPTASQLSALVTVEAHGPLSPTELAEREGVSAPTASRVLAALVDAGWLERATAEADRRCAVVALTPAGGRLLARLRADATAELARRIERLAPAERARLAAALPVLDRLNQPIG